MKKYKITGMSCAACSARVQKAVEKLEGVSRCDVNLLTSTMNVEGDFTDDKIIKAVTDAGYGISGEKGEEKEKDKTISNLLKRLIYSLIFTLVLMYVSMGHVMWNAPLPSFFKGNFVAIALLQMILAVCVAVINQSFFINGYKALFKGAPNMDSLVALGSSAAFLYSTTELFLLTANNSHTILHNLYFESSAMILTLITVGKLLEAHSKGKTTNALKALMELAPKTAVIFKEDKEVTVPIEQVKVGDIFIVKAGESIAVDGTVIEGSGTVDESALTGESLPVEKGVGDYVKSATINKSGYLKCRAERVGEDTTLSLIIKTVNDAASSKAPIARIADKVSGVFVPLVIAIALITIAVWLFIGKEFGYALARGISVLVISCPCALGLATPVAIMVGSGVGAKNGILFKNAETLENAGKTDIVVLDKTGTVTSGKPSVTDIISADEEKLLSLAFALENKSEHPLSKAICEYAENKGIALINTENFSVTAGNGVTAFINGKRCVGGNYSFLKDYCEIDEKSLNLANELSLEGKTPMFFAYDQSFLGIIAVADTIKEDSKTAVERLKKMGMRVIMLTGDNINTAKAIAKKAGIDEVIAGVLPNEKEEQIKILKKQGKVMMVGDGINDAPSLNSANTGVAMSNGSYIAADSADIVLMNNRITDVAAAITLSKKVLLNIKENLFWAFIYNTLGIPLAAGVFISLFGFELNPMFGAAAMSLSSFCVVSNALRLNLIDIYCVKTKKKEKINMTKTLKIEGMMCPHCEARVKSVLESLAIVEEAAVSHKDGTAIVTLNGECDSQLLKETVENAGYKVTDLI